MTTLRNKKVIISKKEMFVLINAAILIAIPSVMSVMRYDVGTDHLSYVYRIPLMIQGGDGGLKLPIGFTYLIKMLHRFIKTEIVLYGVITVFEIVMLYVFFLRKTSRMVISVLLFFLLGILNVSFNISRQMLAVAVFFYSTKYIEKKKPIKYIAAIMVAVSIHTVSILYLPIYFLPKIRIKKTYKLFVVMIIIGLLNEPIIFCLEWISRHIPLLGDYYAYFYGRYFADSFSWSILFITMMPMILYCLFDRFNNDNEWCINLCWIACIPGVLNAVIPNADRFVFMFIPAHCVYATKVGEGLKGRSKIWFYGLLILSAGMFYLYYIVILNCGETIPYRTWVV